MTQTFRTEDNISYGGESLDKINILSAAVQPEGLSFRVMKNLYNRNISQS